MSTDLAYSILAQLGRAKRGDDSLAITGGDDPVFVTPWRIAAAGSAALGAVGLAVSDLWRLRTGKPQGVTVDRHAATASLRSNTYVLQNGKRHGMGLLGAVDLMSSAPWFDGWRERLVVDGLEAVVRPITDAKTWMLTIGWRRLGLLRFDELPA